MKINKIMLLAAAVLTWACGQKTQSDAPEQSGEEKPSVTLTKKWETEPVLTTCESVLYDDKNDRLYVANINGGPAEKDNNGFISIVSLDGSVTNEKWVTGMDAPKGMGLHNGKLFVADIDRVHEVDVSTGKIEREHLVEGAVFLNDITVDNEKVYVSDSRGGSIYLIENGAVSKFLSDVEGPNGLFYDNGKLVIGLWNAKAIATLDISSKELVKRTEGVENPDGVEALGNNGYLVSSWNGIVQHVDSDWNNTILLDTRKDSVNAADIEYIKAKNLLLVPTFFKNTVVAYEVTE